METTSLQQLQEMFAGLRAEAGCDIDADMVWSYFFTSEKPEVLESVAEVLEERGFEPVEIFEGDADSSFALQVERIETHTPETLFALNAELESLAASFKNVKYDGMDVDSIGDGEGCGCGCESECEDCNCDKEKVGEHTCGCGCRTESEPIENPELVEAMDNITHELSEESEQALMLQLQRGLYLVPVFSGRIDTDPTDDETVQVLVCIDEKDMEFLPLFTDEAALKAWTGEKVSAMVLTAPEAWDFILSQPECSGGVVNPGGAGLPLNREMVALLKKMIDTAEAEVEE